MNLMMYSDPPVLNTVGVMFTIVSLYINALNKIIGHIEGVNLPLPFLFSLPLNDFSMIFFFFVIELFLVKNCFPQFLYSASRNTKQNFVN